MDFFSVHNQNLCRPVLFSQTCVAQVKSGEMYPNRVVGFGLN